MPPNHTPFKDPTTDQWLFQSPFRLTQTEYRQGWWLYFRHRMGGWQVMTILALGTLCGLVAIAIIMVQLLLGVKPNEDFFQVVGSIALLTIVFGAVLLTPIISGHDPATRPDQDLILRCNDFDIEIETKTQMNTPNKTRRWLWPHFWVYLEAPDVYVLVRQNLHLILPKNAIPPRHHHWFHLMAQQATSPRRDIRHDFEVIVNNPADPPPPT